MTYKNSNQSAFINDIVLSSVALPEEQVPASNAVQQSDSSDGIPYYTVQFLSLKKPVASYDLIKKLEHGLITEYKCNDGFYRYSYGTYKGFKAALKGKDKVLGTGLWHDCFIRSTEQYIKLTEKTEKQD